jgi:hypothetical protein
MAVPEERVADLLLDGLAMHMPPDSRQEARQSA